MGGNVAVEGVGADGGMRGYVPNYVYVDHCTALS